MDDPRIPPPPTASSAEAPLQPTAPADPPITTGKGVKETIESILIAFILAFVFRAFVVEAFVIPTGSMATTLLGAHMRFTCKECGYQFDVNYYPPRHNGEEIDIPARAGENSATPVTYGLYCPNCRYKVSLKEATNPAVRYGDRILVLKYLYIPWVSSPHRWDVVVFKAPTPVDNTPLYTTNYIKRLVGLPGEWIMVLDGDLYVCNDPKYAHIAPEEASKEIPSSAWQIQRKPRYAQDALWRIIYDHDYRPLDKDRTDGWKLPWVHDRGDGWDTGDKNRSRSFVFNSADAGGRLSFDPTTLPRYLPTVAPGGYFTDWLAYDVTMSQGEGDYYRSTGDYSVYTVSDFKLDFTYERKSGTGPLRARLTKHNHEFVVELTPDGAGLKHVRPDGSSVAIGPLIKVDRAMLSGPVRVEFQNVDYQVSVRLNGRLAFETTPQEYSPDVADLKSRYSSRPRKEFNTPTVAIDAGAPQSSVLSHVSLWRDVYYTPEDTGRREIPHASPNTPTKLGDDEYFVMGDNSALSADARYWPEEVHLPDEGNLNVQSGRVPGRFMLGRAFFVYWPAGFRPLDRAPALVPDFGDMRLIH